MRKLLIAVPVLLTLLFGYLYLRTLRLDIGALEGETATVRRGDLTIPINAAGRVMPDSRREIKAEASGEVDGVLVHAGDVVEEGDLLLRLKPDDEQRNVTRAEQDLTRAKANLRLAELTKQQRETVGIQTAKKRLAALQARMIYVEADWEFNAELYEEGEKSSQEYFRAKSAYEELQAQIQQSEADVRQAEIAIAMAEQDVKLAQAAVETAKATLGDAEKRLAKTNIVAPVDGMVAQVFVSEGEVIQGGKTTLTGGTVLAVLADWSRCFVRAEVDEADIGDVLELAPPEARPGVFAVEEARLASATTQPTPPIEAASTVNIEVEAFRDQDFEGVIHRIYPEPKSGSSIVTYLIDIRVTSDNSHLLMSSMQADVRFTAKSVYDAVLVPHEAIKRGPDNELGVYKAVKKPEAIEPEPEFVRCRIGLDNGMYAQVIEGVKEGDVVFTKLPQKTEGEREREARR